VLCMGVYGVIVMTGACWASASAAPAAVADSDGVAQTSEMLCQAGAGGEAGAVVGASTDACVQVMQRLV
jgi:hypothetical protein